ncbi:MAG: 4-hydroxy-tetrahydrodipicolinate reductase [bacterium]|nr:4-hydroxy-tetrahydrodipicolinate reductase [Candidatus Sumerlaeota bacterium]
MSSQVIDIVISGGFGRMGQAIQRLALQDTCFRITGLVESAELVARHGNTVQTADGRQLPVASYIHDLHPSAGSVLIEFTSPEATRKNAAESAELGMKMVIGTTGLVGEPLEEIRSISKRTAVLAAPNMSVGINVLLGLARKLSAALPDFDVEIIEAHHRHKKDAPSGTALALAGVVAEGRGTVPADVVRHGRSGIAGERPKGEIGVHAVRGGDIVGDHTVLFAGDGECIELIHRANNRDTFAAGALRAAKFIARQQNGFFTMLDALGL